MVDSLATPDDSGGHAMWQTTLNEEETILSAYDALLRSTSHALIIVGNLVQGEEVLPQCTNKRIKKLAV